MALNFPNNINISKIPSAPLRVGATDPLLELEQQPEQVPLTIQQPTTIQPQASTGVGVIPKTPTIEQTSLLGAPGISIGGAPTVQSAIQGDPVPFLDAAAARENESRSLFGPLDQDLSLSDSPEYRSLVDQPLTEEEARDISKTKGFFKSFAGFGSLIKSKIHDNKSWRALSREHGAEESANDFRFWQEGYYRRAGPEDVHMLYEDIAYINKNTNKISLEKVEEEKQLAIQEFNGRFGGNIKLEGLDSYFQGVREYNEESVRFREDIGMQSPEELAAIHDSAIAGVKIGKSINDIKKADADVANRVYENEVQGVMMIDSEGKVVDNPLVMRAYTNLYNSYKVKNGNIQTMNASLRANLATVADGMPKYAIELNENKMKLFEDKTKLVNEGLIRANKEIARFFAQGLSSADADKALDGRLKDQGYADLNHFILKDVIDIEDYRVDDGFNLKEIWMKPETIGGSKYLIPNRADYLKDEQLDINRSIISTRQSGTPLRTSMATMTNLFSEGINKLNHITNNSRVGAMFQEYTNTRAGDADLSKMLKADPTQKYQSFGRNINIFASDNVPEAIPMLAAILAPDPISKLGIMTKAYRIGKYTISPKVTTAIAKMAEFTAAQYGKGALVGGAVQANLPEAYSPGDEMFDILFSVADIGSLVTAKRFRNMYDAGGMDLMRKLRIHSPDVKFTDNDVKEAHKLFNKLQKGAMQLSFSDLGPEALEEYLKTSTKKSVRKAVEGGVTADGLIRDSNVSSEFDKAIKRHFARTKIAEALVKTGGKLTAEEYRMMRQLKLDLNDHTMSAAMMFGMDVPITIDPITLKERPIRIDTPTSTYSAGEESYLNKNVLTNIPDDVKAAGVDVHAIDKIMDEGEAKRLASKLKDGVYKDMSNDEVLESAFIKKEIDGKDTYTLNTKFLNIEDARTGNDKTFSQLETNKLASESNFYEVAESNNVQNIGLMKERNIYDIVHDICKDFTGCD